MSPAAPEDQRWFFIQIPDTGADRFYWDLRRNFRPEEVYPDPRPDGDDPSPLLARTNIDYLMALPPERVARIRVYTGAFPFIATEVIGGEFTRITLLADPVQRAVDRLQREAAAPRLEGLDLEEVYEHASFRRPSNDMTKFFSLTPHDGLNSYRDPARIDASRLERATRNLAKVDVVGLNEQYSEFLAEVTRRFGWEMRPPPDAPEPPTGPEPDAALLERIRADVAFDIELYAFAEKLLIERRSG